MAAVPFMVRGGAGAMTVSEAESCEDSTMPNDTGKLYLYEALELRSAYDKEIRLLARLISPEDGRRGSFLTDRDSAERRPATGLDSTQALVPPKPLRPEEKT